MHGNSYSIVKEENKQGANEMTNEKCIQLVVTICYVSITSQKITNLLSLLMSDKNVSKKITIFMHFSSTCKDSSIFVHEILR